MFFNTTLGCAYGCLPLFPGNSLQVTTSTKTPVCFSLELSQGEGTQIVAEQPKDLELTVGSASGKTTFDAFEFGKETATISEAGKYIVVVRPVDSSRSLITFLMSRKALSLQKAQQLSTAEKLASVAKHLGDPGETEKSLKSWMAIGDEAATARTWLELGDALIALGDIKPGRLAYENAREICKKTGDLRCEAEADNNSGLAAQQSGKFADAMERLSEAATGWRTLHEAAAEGLTLSNIGLLYWYTNDFAHAITNFDKASAILARLDRAANAVVMNNLGLCYQSLAQYGYARRYFERALTGEMGVPGQERAAMRARLNLGRNYMLNRQFKAAAPILDKAIREATRLKDKAGLADALSNRGQNALARGNFTEAQQDLEQALQLHRSIGDKRMERTDLHYLGETAKELNNFVNARQALDDAIVLGQQYGLREGTLDSTISLARIEIRENQPEKAKALASRGLSVLESLRGNVPGPEMRASYYARRRNLFDVLMLAELALNSSSGVEAGFLVSDKGRARALLDTLAQTGVLRKVPAELAARRSAIEKEISLSSFQKPAVELPASKLIEQQATYRRHMQDLVSQRELVEARIEEIVKLPIAEPLKSVVQLQASAIPEGTALLEYYLAAPDSYAWVVKHSSISVFPLPARDKIESTARKMNDLFVQVQQRKRSPQLQRQFDKATRALSAMLLGPLRSASLPARVIIVPDGGLNQTPFAALWLPGGDRLGLKHDLIHAPAASFLVAEGKGSEKIRKVNHFPKTFLGVVDPVYSLDDPRLAGSRVGKPAQNLPRLERLPFSSELEIIYQLVPAKRREVLRGFKANVNELRASHVGEYAVIHLSTHALIDNQLPQLSSVALSMVTATGNTTDGFLRPYQLANFSFNGATVVLSACQTALGKQIMGEGLIGLTGSLFQAGASRLVVSLSDVDAEASTEFFKDTYRNFFGPGGGSMEHSLRVARLEMARSERWSDPFYWATFIAMGQPSPATAFSKEN